VLIEPVSTMQRRMDSLRVRALYGNFKHTILRTDLCSRHVDGSNNPRLLHRDCEVTPQTFSPCVAHPGMAGTYCPVTAFFRVMDYDFDFHGALIIAEMCFPLRSPLRLGVFA